MSYQLFNNNIKLVSSIGTAMVSLGLSTFSKVFLQGGSAWVKPSVKFVEIGVESRGNC